MAERKTDPREGHRQRLRDKFTAYGLEKMTDEEVLELLLSFGTPRKDCKQIARDMLKEFGTLRDVFEAKPELLAQIKGAGPTNIVAIKFIHAVAGKYLEKRLLGRDYLGSSRQVVEYLRHDLENRDKELFKIIHLDNSNLVLAVEDVSQGSVNEAYVDPREIIERGLTMRSSALIFVHNHPSGKLDPSFSDQKLTRHLVHATYMVKIKTIDHIIIGQGGAYFSFKDHGLIGIYEQEIGNAYQAIPSKGSSGLLHEDQGAVYQPRKSRGRPKKAVPAAEPVNGVPAPTSMSMVAEDEIYWAQDESPVDRDQRDSELKKELSPEKVRFLEKYDLHSTANHRWVSTRNSTPPRIYYRHQFLLRNDIMEIVLRKYQFCFAKIKYFRTNIQKYEACKHDPRLGFVDTEMWDAEFLRHRDSRKLIDLRHLQRISDVADFLTIVDWLERVE